MKDNILKKIKIINKKYINYEKMMISKKFYIAPYNIKKIITKKYKKFNKIIKLYKLWIENEENIEIANLIILTDKNIKNKLNKFIIKKKYIENLIYDHFIYKDNNDIYNSLIEIHASTGGNESSLFAQDLFKMYVKYCEINNWIIKIVNINYNEMKGYKEITFIVEGNNSYKKLKFESGCHRVQRIPITENQGRLHTSICSIAVIPIIPEKKLPLITNKDLKIDTFKSSGAGGQHVNTTDSAIRITHIPTGLTIECQDERSQHKNKAKALLILKNKIYNLENINKKKKLSLEKKKLLGTGERSSKIRTYNFPQNRVTDHRINLTIYNLTEILNGNLDLILNPLIKNYTINILNNV